MIRRTFFIFLLALLVWGGAARPLAAQQQQPKPASPAPPPAQKPAAPPADPQDDGGDAISVEVTNVSLPVTVLDGDGRFISGLKQKDFAVFENKRQQEIIAFEKRDGLPLNVVVAMDTSTSIRNRLAFEREAIIEFLEKLLDNRRDQAALTTFDDEVRIRAGFTSDFARIASSVRGVVKADGQTAMYDAVKKICAEQVPAANTKRRAILLITDGGDTASTTTLDQAIRAAQKAEVAIYAISTKGGGVFRVEGNPYLNIDDKDLKRLCKDTGGDVFFPSDMGQLKKAFKLAEAYLRNQYFIVYEPSEGRSKQFREIEVRVTSRKDTRVLTRRGYFSE